MDKYNLLIAFMIVLSFAIGIFIYPQMPDRMPSHWNAAGQVDGYMPRFWAVFLMPVFSVGLFILFLAIPKIDPKKENIEKFMPYYQKFVAIIIGFMLYIYLLTLLWPLGYTFDIIVMLVPAFSLIFYYAGVLIQNAKQNWFIGIRTPWTLSSEHVWNKTHKLGGKLFKAAAIISLAGLLFRDYAIWIVLIPVIFVTIYTLIYSYTEFQKERTHGHHHAPSRKPARSHPHKRKKR